MESEVKHSSRDVDVLSTCSEASSICDEERIRKLFQVCDKNGDGYIDSNDLQSVCQELDMEDVLQDILVELGADENGMVSFEEFLQKRLALKSDIRALKDSDSKCRGNDPNLSSSGTSLGGLSASKEMWEFDSGAHDLSPIPNTLQRLIKLPGNSIAPSSSTGILELANKLHMAAVDSLRSELSQLTALLEEARLEFHTLKKEIERCQDYMVESMRETYEEQITELHSVIAELSRKVEKQSHSIIEEETTSDVELNQPVDSKVTEEDDNSEDSHLPTLSDEEEKKQCVIPVSRKINPKSVTNLPPRLTKIPSQEADIEYWKALYHKEKADAVIIEAHNQTITAKLNQMSLLFAQHESSVYAYDVALTLAREVIDQYSQLDSYMYSAWPKKVKRPKEEQGIRENLNKNVTKLEKILANLTPFKFFSESNTFEVPTYEPKPNIDIEAAILTQCLMQERVEQRETRQKLIQALNDYKSLQQKLQKIEGSDINLPRGSASNKHYVNREKSDDVEVSIDQGKVDLLPSLQYFEKTGKVKLLENSFTQLVTQQSEQVMILMRRIQYLENSLAKCESPLKS